jgi:hypothetical protein
VGRACTWLKNKSAQTAVDNYEKVAKWHATELGAIEEYKAESEGIWEGAGKRTERQVHEHAIKKCESQ